jgi:hypothetical protein
MKHSTDRILTSHAGSLPRPQALIEVNQAKLEGRALDEKTYEARLQQAVEDTCRKQVELGIDVINDGEFGKVTRGAIDYGAWTSYAWARLKGWEPGEARALPALAGRRDRQNSRTSIANMTPRAFSPPACCRDGRRCSRGRSPMRATPW